MMKLFIDCEFNEFKGDLISMALVDEQGVFFYEVLPCPNPGAWVAEHVIPILEKKPIRLDQLQSRLQAFLSHYDSVHLIADWPEDIKHFCDALITGPGMRINTPALTMEIRRDLDAVSRIPHNALADAFAIRTKYMEIA
jgi:hypothetical protein